MTPNAPTKLCAKYELNATQDKEVIEFSLWFPYQLGIWVTPVVPRKLLAKYEFHMTKELQDKMYFHIIVIISLSSDSLHSWNQLAQNMVTVHTVLTLLC